MESLCAWSDHPEPLWNTYTVSVAERRPYARRGQRGGAAVNDFVVGP